MLKPKKRRRIVLPLLLVTGLASAGSAGGYLYYKTLQDESPERSAEAQNDLDAGFESAQGNDTLDAVANAWENVQSTSEPRDAYATRYEATGSERPLPSVPPAPSDRSYEEADRYAMELLAKTKVAPVAVNERLPEVVPVAPLASVDSLPAIEAAAPGDRYGELASAPVADIEALSPSEPSPSEPIARGQSPSLERPTIEAIPANNPLRESGSLSQSPTAPLVATLPPAVQPSYNTLQEVGPDPSAGASGNSLRSLPPQPEPTVAPKSFVPVGSPTPADFTDARPIRDENRSSNLGPVAATRSPLSARTRSSKEELGDGKPGERALEGPQRPALVLQKSAPNEIQVGKACTFTIRVRNVGQRPADNVIVSDQVPRGTRFLSASPQVESSDGSLVWQLGTLSPGEERTMEIKLMPTEEGEIGSVAQVTFASHASAKANCTRPQLALRMSAPSEVLVGRQQRVTIELHNPGSGDATNVMLLENVPENVRHASGPALEFEIGTLRTGETRRMELVLTAEKAGRVVNVLTARADGNLQVEQRVEFEVIAPAITVGLAGPSKRYLERPATYTVNVSNPGSATAKDVQIVTKLPKGLEFVRANNMGEYDSATHSVYWSLAELPKGQDGTVELVALPIQSGDHTISVEGRAREGLEDRTTKEIRIEGLAAIMFEVADLQDPIEVGGSTSYEIRVVNQGSKAAANVQVTALVPPGLTVVGASGETRHTVEAEGVVFEPLARLAPKADTIFRIDVMGALPGDQRLLVEVTTDDIQQPIRKEESTHVFGDE